MACKYIYENKEYTKEEFYKFVGDNLVEKKSVPKYNKILFPTGNTASKVEGHTTLEEFKKQKEDRIKELETPKINSFGENMFTITGIDDNWRTKEAAIEFTKTDKYKKIIDKEITQLKQELERVEKEGFGALKPIYNFYENVITNILNKQGYNPTLITDEYGNTWNEININQARDLDNILLQKDEANRIIGQANIKAMTVLIDAVNQKADTLPHEYAHHYIAWFRDTPIVQEAIKKWGSEEALVQAIGEQVVKQKGEALNWWNKFVKFILNQFNSLSKLKKEELSQILTDAFLTRKNLNDFRKQDDIEEQSAVKTNNNRYYQIRSEKQKEQAEKNIQELDEYLLNFLKSFGVRAKEFDELKTRLGVDALGATDIFNKIIWYAKDRNSHTLPEEAAHMIVMLLGERHSIIHQLINTIDKWSEYQSIYDEYMPYYKNEKQVRIEAVGKLLSKSLVKNYKAVGLNQSVINKLIHEVTTFINKLLVQLNIKKLDEFSEHLADHIALNILAGNVNYIRNFKNEHDSLDFNNVIQNNPFAKSIIDKFINLGSRFSGSLAVATDGQNIHRDGSKPIHDLDFETSQKNFENILQKINSMKGVPIHYGWESDTKTTYSFLIPKEGYRIEDVQRGDRLYIKSYRLIDEKTGIEMEKSADRVITCDFFVYPNDKYDENANSFVNFNDVFSSKMHLSPIGANERMFQRDKDLNDYINLKPNKYYPSPSSGIYYQLKENNIQDEKKQSDFIQKLESVNDTNIIKVDGKNENGEETNWYEINGKKVVNRVTDLAKRFYEIIFRDKKITESEFSKTLNEEKRKFGVMGHKMFEEAKASLTDDQGALLQNEKDDSAFVASLTENQKEVYNILKDNLRERMNLIAQKYPGVKFFSEKIIYSPNIRQGGEAGTVDFMYVTKEGKIGILDWKFININEKYSQDVPWYKRKAWKIQLEEYKKILEKNYGVKKGDVIEASAVPILMRVEISNSVKGDEKIINIGNIEIGDANTKLESRGYLIPVSLDYISTGYKNVDRIIERLNGLYDKIAGRKVLTDEESAQKVEQLTELFRAIRDLQMKLSFKNLLTFAQNNKKDVEGFITNLKELLSESEKTGELTDDKKSEISSVIDEAKKELEIFKDIDLYIDEVFQDKEQLTDEDKEVAEMLKQVTYDARKMDKKLEEVESEFLQKVIADPHGVDKLLNIERVVTGLRRWFGDTSGIAIKTLSIIYKLRNKAKNNTDFEVSEENEKLNSLKEEYTSWAKSKGLTIKNMFDGIIKKKEKNELIDEFNPEFYKQLKEAISKTDRAWVYKNVDMDALKNFLDEKLQAELQRIEDRNYSGTDKEIDEYKQKLIERAYQMYDLENMNSYADLIYDNVKKFPKRELWESNEYKYLKQNEPAFKFYNYIKERNQYYQDIGYISAKEARVFLPYVRKSLTEKLVFGGDIKLGEQFLNSISLDETTFGYGAIDPITKEPINELPKYFVSPIENNQDVSTDLFKNIALYNEMAIRYKYLSDIEGQVLHLLRTEKNKKVMQTTLFGNIKRDPYTNEVREISDDSNFKLVQAHVDAILYDKKTTQDKDIKLGTIGNAFNKVNEKLGYNIFPTNLEGKSISLNRLLDSNNKLFQQRILGVNVLSSISNLLGGSFQSIISAGKYFTKTQFMAAELRLTASKLNREDGKYIMAMLKYFMPLTESENRKMIKELSLSKLSQENIQDFLMSLMRNSDNFVQTSIFLATLDNLIVKDGNIYNAREYLRNNDSEYKKRYDKDITEEQRAKIESDFEHKLKELIKESHIKNFVKINDNNIEIEGVERSSNSIKNIRNIVQNLSKDALGNATEDQTRLINLNIYGKSFMIFKNWIPRLVDVRFGELHHNNAFDAYEWGRTRTFFRFLGQDALESGKILLKSLAFLDGTGSDKSIEAITKLYEKKLIEYEEATGEKLNMTREEFIDMVRQNIRSQMRDFLFYIGLMSAWLLASTVLGGDDDKKHKRSKNMHKFLVRALDKVSDEVGFFYNPLSFQNILNGSVFPSLGNISDALRLMEHTLYETMGLTFGDEKLQKRAHPIKYLGKVFPLSNQVISYMPLMFPDLSKDLGIQISTQSRIK